jgi:hypothetical protein
MPKMTSAVLNGKSVDAEAAVHLRDEADKTKAVSLSFNAMNVVRLSQSRLRLTSARSASRGAGL